MHLLVAEALDHLVYPKGRRSVFYQLAVLLGAVPDSHTRPIRDKVDALMNINGGKHCSHGPSTYGEMEPRGFVDAFRRARARPNETFYDLGAGMSRSLLVAWALGLNAKGVELSQERFNHACGRLSRTTMRAATDVTMAAEPLAASRRILSLARADFLTFDFRDANLVYINSVCWSDGTIRELSRRFRLLPTGARILATVRRGSSHLLDDQPRGLGESPLAPLGPPFLEPVSWGKHSHAFLLYEVLPNVCAGLSAPDCRSTGGFGADDEAARSASRHAAWDALLAPQPGAHQSGPGGERCGFGWWSSRSLGSYLSAELLAFALVFGSVGAVFLGVVWLCL